jgi:hypothetical protein
MLSALALKSIMLSVFIYGWFDATRKKRRVE